MSTCPVDRETAYRSLRALSFLCPFLSAHSFAKTYTTSLFTFPPKYVLPFSTLSHFLQIICHRRTLCGLTRAEEWCMGSNISGISIFFHALQKEVVSLWLSFPPSSSRILRTREWKRWNEWTPLYGCSAGGWVRLSRATLGMQSFSSPFIIGGEHDTRSYLLISFLSYDEQTCRRHDGDKTPGSLIPHRHVTWQTHTPPDRESYLLSLPRRRTHLLHLSPHEFVPLSLRTESLECDWLPNEPISLQVHELFRSILFREDDGKMNPFSMRKGSSRPPSLIFMQQEHRWLMEQNEGNTEIPEKKIAPQRLHVGKDGGRRNLW